MFEMIFLFVISVVFYKVMSYFYVDVPMYIDLLHLVQLCN